MDRGFGRNEAVEKLLKKCYPPGYGYGQEWLSACILMGISTICSFRFFYKLYDAWNRLYVVSDGRRALIEGAAVESFTRLAQGHVMLFVPLPFFLAVMAVYHYLYYYHGAKSIYLMRRLPRRGVLFKSCVQGPLLCMGAGSVLAAVLYLLYALIYFLVIPAECMPRFV